MNLKTLFVSIFAIAFLVNPAFAKKPKHAQKHAEKHGHSHNHGHKHNNKHKKKRLPPGLQKKVDRGQALPPGWQKKVARGQVLDVRVYRQGRVIIPIDKYGAVSILVDDRVIRVIQATRVILDVFNYR
ncbi:MAG: hypothetical protein V7749_18035 [Cocleimonas sp.]